MSKDQNEPRVHRTALIDGDILVWKAAASAQSQQLDEKEFLDRIEFDIEDWKRRAFCSDVIICLSGPRDSNFRKDVYPLYKANRPDERPEFHGMGIEILTKNHTIFKREALEADDCLGLLATLRGPDGEPVVMNPVIVSEDKDLRTVSGWHFNPNITAKRGEDFPTFVTRQAAERAFITQWMIGDATDGYKGIDRFGEKGAEKFLSEHDSIDWEYAALQKYQGHKKGYTYEYALQMARCARILTADWWDSKTKTPVLWVPDQNTMLAIRDNDNLQEWIEIGYETVTA